MHQRDYLVVVAASLCLSIQSGECFHINEYNATSNQTSDIFLAEGGSENDSLDDRFNLNFNVAQAQGIGRFGGQSLSNSVSYGINAGIRNSHGQYQNLLSRTGSNSNGFSSGPGAPLTFANTASRVRPGHAGGNAASGLLGGKGTAFAKSHNQNIVIPLDNRGTVLLSNLKVPQNSTHQEQRTQEDQQFTNSKDSNLLPIVFV